MFHQISKQRGVYWRTKWLPNVWTDSEIFRFVIKPILSNVWCYIPDESICNPYPVGCEWNTYATIVRNYLRKRNIDKNTSSTRFNLLSSYLPFDQIGRFWSYLSQNFGIIYAKDNIFHLRRILLSCTCSHVFCGKFCSVKARHMDISVILVLKVPIPILLFLHKTSTKSDRHVLRSLPKQILVLVYIRPV